MSLLYPTFFVVTTHAVVGSETVVEEFIATVRTNEGNIALLGGIALIPAAVAARTYPWEKRI